MPKKPVRVDSTERAKRSGQTKPKNTTEATNSEAMKQEAKVESNHDSEIKENTEPSKKDIKKTKNVEEEAELESTNTDQAKKSRGRALKINIEHW